ncbi:single-stranded DNA-binding protein [candidate division KSB1 bacterium]
MGELRMPAVNNVLIAGNLTKDPTFRKTTKGTPVSNFPIACSRRYKDSAGNFREEVCYVGVVAWYKLAESCSDFLTKGSAVMVEGELQSKNLKSELGQFRNIVEIKAKRIQFLNKSNQEFIYDSEYDTVEETSGYDQLQNNVPLAADSDRDETDYSINDDKPDSKNDGFGEIRF